uniref:(northern house mosquito) hypothetical protein n=1 Tax=Culex pipiens TaxID=7175 RepID=A0A8D8IZD2_CULPI
MRGGKFVVGRARTAPHHRHELSIFFQLWLRSVAQRSHTQVRCSWNHNNNYSLSTINTLIVGRTVGGITVQEQIFNNNLVVYDYWKRDLHSNSSAKATKLQSTVQRTVGCSTAINVWTDSCKNCLHVIGSAVRRTAGHYSYRSRITACYSRCRGSSKQALRGGAFVIGRVRTAAPTVLQVKYLKYCS